MSVVEKPTAIDLFAGAGGATQGLLDAGFDVLTAVENDHDAASTYRANHPNVDLVESDIRRVTATGLLARTRLPRGDLTLLKACPPCQGFSSLRGGRAVSEQRNDLVLDIVRFARVLKPRAILLENVPGLRKDARFGTLRSKISRLGYTWVDYRIDAEMLGVPQRRRRLVVVAVRHGISAPGGFDQLIPPINRRPAASAGDALAMLKMAGPFSETEDPLHIWRSSSPAVRARIAAVPIGGSRFDLPAELQLRCHAKLDANGRVATSSYGRIRMDAPAPTMTTRCTTPACGSFIHPTEHRGLSLREAATLQTFPVSYKFIGGYDSIERQIGNAVPVWMAEALGLAVRRLLSC